jgi:hypothetical protein
MIKAKPYGRAEYISTKAGVLAPLAVAQDSSHFHKL